MNNLDEIYRQKYLKYKKKYLDLKQFAGANHANVLCNESAYNAPFFARETERETYNDAIKKSKSELEELNKKLSKQRLIIELKQLETDLTKLKAEFLDLENKLTLKKSNLEELKKYVGPFDPKIHNDTNNIQSEISHIEFDISNKKYAIKDKEIDKESIEGYIFRDNDIRNIKNQIAKEDGILYWNSCKIKKLDETIEKQNAIANK